MSTIKLSELHIYPVKSLAGISLNESVLDERGLQFDRRWMLVDTQGHFLSQRQHAQMALIQTAITGGRLTLSKAGMADLLIPATGPASKQMRVTVWGDEVLALHIADEVDAWLRLALGLQCHLVYFPDSALRQVDLNYAKIGDNTGFSDGFPLLLIGQASLDDLNQRLAEAIPMRRFRPNLVVSGCEAYAEDRWQLIRVSNLAMRVVKPCSRCAITTIDPDTGEKTGKEPLRTLSQYRGENGKVYFGQNVIHDQTGVLRIGDEITLIS